MLPLLAGGETRERMGLDARRFDEDRFLFAPLLPGESRGDGEAGRASRRNFFGVFHNSSDSECVKKADFGSCLVPAAPS